MNDMPFTAEATRRHLSPLTANGRVELVF